MYEVTITVSQGLPFREYVVARNHFVSAGHILLSLIL